ncbi:hypothetical protein [Halopiger djelfimassiliensis]|uniref:hypothetical protein n=1 Tax=Halopiger djelfimassiliensis TaxID=1293047 RepID=UPI000677AD31|nr:hypothetical protein [Halopiger djelfimassiliensis]
MSLIVLGAVLLLCLLPSLLFLGFWRGLVAMQRRSLVTRASSRTGDTDPAVTWGDVIDAYADPEKSLFTPSSEPHAQPDDGRCVACSATNDPVATFCRHCLRKLE